MEVRERAYREGLAIIMRHPPVCLLATLVAARAQNSSNPHPIDRSLAKVTLAVYA